MKVLFDGTCIWITEPGYAGSRSVCVSLNRHNELTGALESIVSPAQPIKLLLLSKLYAARILCRNFRRAPATECRN